MSSELDQKLSPKTAAVLELAADTIAGSVKSILNICNAHGVLQGTLEEAITSAQGAIMLKSGWTPWDHEESARGARRGLDNNIREIYKTIVEVKDIDPWCSLRLSKVVDPVTDLGSMYNGILKEALKYTEALKGSPYANRLEGVMFEQRGRGVNGLISTQIQRRPVNRLFIDRGIAQSIYPVSNDASHGLDRRIKTLPASFEDQSARLGPLRNALDREIHSTGGMSRGGPLLQIFFDPLKRKL